MEYAVVTVPAAPVRRMARHPSEMVNQLLFGETVEIIKTKKKGWAKVRSLHDGYQGWLTRNMLEAVEEKQSGNVSEFVTTDILAPVTINGKEMQVPFGSSLPCFSNGTGSIGNLVYLFNGNCANRIDHSAGLNGLLQFATRWLNVPYLWGGRTPLGADCSWFVQVICKMSGTDLPRDTWQQAQEGKPIKKIKDAQAGDLAFFDDRDEIAHVGILLNSHQIIHAWGKVRIDAIDRKGIMNAESGQRTHRLKAIRRLW